MLRTTTRAAFLAVGLLIPACLASAQERVDALRFAIEYFDPAHVRGITGGDPETDYMLGALDAAREVDTHLRLITNRLYSHTLCTCGMSDIDQMVDEVHALEMTIDVDDYTRILRGAGGKGAVIPEYASVIRLAERTVGSWGKRRETEETDREKRSVTYYYDDEDTPRNVDTTSIDQRLRRGGYMFAILETRESKRGLEEASFYLVRRDAGDMDYFARALMLDDSLKAVFEPFKPRKVSGDMIGDGSWIKLASPKTPGQFGVPLTFTFSLGWGDCPAGCMARHFWHVKVTPSKPQGRNSWKFRAELISEDGPAVPHGVGPE